MRLLKNEERAVIVLNFKGISKIEAAKKTWALFASTDDDVSQIHREVDNLFSEYSFYPQIDWKNYGYLPPDNCQVLGAWRHPQTKAFVFLLDDNAFKKYGETIQLSLEIAGEISEVSRFEPRINDLK